MRGSHRVKAVSRVGDPIEVCPFGPGDRIRYLASLIDDQNFGANVHRKIDAYCASRLHPNAAG